MKQLSAVLASAALMAGPVMATGLIAPAGAGAAPVATATVTSAAASGKGDPYHAKERFAREFTRRGDSDSSVYDIEHVRELQYRLRWAGVYKGPVTGTFGDLTRGAVKRYQRREDLEVTGTANARTWKQLIPQTVRGRTAIPNRCKLRNGRHICYDRTRHQVTLWKRGTLWNSWLVRGGDYSYQTRTGHFSVYSRDRDHVSGLYGSPMPYSQFFSGGQAFHGSTYMTDPFSGHSHGCVNMYIEDARQLWRLTSKQPLKVHVYGAWD